MDVKEKGARLKAQVEARSGRGAKWRYDDEFRAEVVEYVRERQARGGTLEEVGRELGLSAWTLSRWSRERGPKKQGAAASGESAVFQPVTVKPEKAVAEGRHTVHGPGGVRVEGLTLQQVAALLRELS
jgi:transposase